MNSASCAIDSISSSAAYNPAVSALVTEFERLSRNGRDLASDLSAGARYKGLRRGSMSVALKSEYISCAALKLTKNSL